jgi:hypothetical protein
MGFSDLYLASLYVRLRHKHPLVDQTNLVSDQPGAAATTDPDLVNPWGISFAPTSRPSHSN